MNYWGIKDTDRTEGSYGKLLPLAKPEIYTSRKKARAGQKQFTESGLGWIEPIKCCVVKLYVTEIA